VRHARCVPERSGLVILRALAVLAVGAPGGGIFRRETKIDCRWVYTLPKPEVESGHRIGQLPQSVMEEIDEAVVSGLQMI
jgi:hypothetical protein